MGAVVSFAPFFGQILICNSLIPLSLCVFGGWEFPGSATMNFFVFSAYLNLLWISSSTRGILVWGEQGMLGVLQRSGLSFFFYVLISSYELLSVLRRKWFFSLDSPLILSLHFWYPIGNFIWDKHRFLNLSCVISEFRRTLLSFQNSDWHLLIGLNFQFSPCFVCKKIY